MIVLGALGTTPGGLGWIESALIIFFVVFVLIVIGVLLRKRGHFDHAARIPLDDAPNDSPVSSEEPTP
jgi:cbb3-type cytochrome oxidase subunit 3